MTTEELKNAKIGDSYVCSNGQPMPKNPPDGTYWVHMEAKLKMNPDQKMVWHCDSCGFDLKYEE